MALARYKVVHSYSTTNGATLIHHWHTDDPEKYLAEVKVKAPLAKLLRIEEVA